ncbi:odorant receptor 59a-like [Lucilia sericata]|uniref:odorant receptor 59a-like n=1 Tax=Lucilia sericata TaxID=13632 RepID=UPI0018A825FC|nr:odorant receptor 59a-like [Lucilia sericata]
MNIALQQPSLQGEKSFHLHFFFWRILGNSPGKDYRELYIIYSIFINVIITIGYPLHLMIGLFESKTKFDIIKNLAINLTCLACSIKTFAIWLKFKNVRLIFDIIRKQDKRINKSKDEYEYYKMVVFPSLDKIMLMFKVLFMGAGLTSEVAVLTNGFLGSWRLMYPAFFPFDPFANQWLYTLAHVYQFFGVSFQILQNLVNDTFAGMHMALLSGQVHILSMRVSKIGYDPKKSKEDNNRELLECIQDHKDLLEYRRKLEEVVSQYMFVQILFTSINMCVTIVFLILFARDPFTLIYYFIYLICMPAEILPACYYGTIMEFEFQNLSYALFSTNWMDQSIEFKKNLRIFAEQANKPLYLMAWLVRINMTSFLYACKNAYSLFAVVMNIK